MPSPRLPTFVAGILAAIGSAPPCPVPPSAAAGICIVQGDDAGTAAALASLRLGLPTVLTLWAARDLGGDLASAVRTDLMVPARIVGGLSSAYDRFARRSYNTPCGYGTARIAPPGPSFEFLRGLLTGGGPNSTLTLLSGWLPLPGGGLVDSDGAVAGLTLVNESGSTCTLACSHVIEGSSEGYALRAFNATTRFGREGPVVGTDVTNAGEVMAGRRLWGACTHTQASPQGCVSPEGPRAGSAPVWANVSDLTPEAEDVSMAASAIFALRHYAPGRAAPDSPWIITTPPAGYNASDYWWLEADPSSWDSPSLEGCLSADICRAEYEYAAGLPRWYEVNHSSSSSSAGGVQHYLRVPGDPWAPKREVERRAWAGAAGALYFLHQKGRNMTGWGFDNSSDTAGPAAGCYTLESLGGAAAGGAAYGGINCRLYRRVTTRLASGDSVGGQALLTRLLFAHGTPERSRTFWEPAALGVPMYPVDYRGVLATTVPTPDWAGPEGMVSLVYAGMNGVDMHGLHRRIVEPDPAAGPGAPANLLSPGSPRTTFQAQAALRIHCVASNLGVSSLALVAAARASGAATVRAAPTALAQWIAVSAPLWATIWMADSSMAGTPSYTLSQLPGAYGVPPAQFDTTTWAPVLPTHADAALWLAMYANGLLLGAIPRWPPYPAAPPPPPLPSNVTFPFPSDSGRLTLGDLAALLDAIVPFSASAVMSLPLPAPDAPALLADIRAVLTRHILYVKGVLSLATPPLLPYTPPAYLLSDSFNVPPGPLRETPDWAPVSAGPCTCDAALGITNGLLVLAGSGGSSSIHARLCPVTLPSSSASQRYRVSVEMGIEQVPVAAGEPSLTNAGLYFLFSGLDTTQHGWFGLLSDANATGARGGYEPDQALLWGLRVPGSDGVLLQRSFAWPDGAPAAFELAVVFDGDTGATEALLDGAVIMNHTISPPFSTVGNFSFGVRAGEGGGRALFQNLVLAAWY